MNPPQAGEITRKHPALSHRLRQLVWWNRTSPHLGPVPFGSHVRARPSYAHSAVTDMKCQVGLASPCHYKRTLKACANVRTEMTPWPA